MAQIAKEMNFMRGAPSPVRMVRIATPVFSVRIAAVNHLAFVCVACSPWLQLLITPSSMLSSGNGDIVIAAVDASSISERNRRNFGCRERSPPCREGRLLRVKSGRQTILTPVRRRDFGQLAGFRPPPQGIESISVLPPASGIPPSAPGKLPRIERTL